MSKDFEWFFKIGREHGSSLSYAHHAPLSGTSFAYGFPMHSNGQSELSIRLPVSDSSLEAHNVVANNWDEYDIEVTVTAKKKFKPGYYRQVDRSAVINDAALWFNRPPWQTDGISTRADWQRVKVVPDND